MSFELEHKPTQAIIIMDWDYIFHPASKHSQKSKLSELRELNVGSSLQARRENMSTIIAQPKMIHDHDRAFTLAIPGGHVRTAA